MTKNSEYMKMEDNLQDKYEVGYTKFDEIAVFSVVHIGRLKDQVEKIDVRFKNFEMSMCSTTYNGVKQDDTYDDIIEIKKRYEWIEIPYVIYKHIFQYIEEHTPF